MVLLRFALSVTGTYRLRFFAEKTEGAERTGCWTPFVNTRVPMTHQLQLRGRYQLVKDFYQKRTETNLHKKISKKKSTPCRDGSMHECMHWLTKYKNKTCHAHSTMHSINMATLFNNHPYISSSKF